MPESGRCIGRLAISHPEVRKLKVLMTSLDGVGVSRDRLLIQVLCPSECKSKGNRGCDWARCTCTALRSYPSDI